MNTIKRIVISRTDSIGDVALTLPLAGILKEQYPEIKVIFLGQGYTEPIIRCCAYVDEIWKWDEIEKNPNKTEWLKEQKVDAFIHVFPRKEIAKWVKKAKVKNRIGTSHRLFHFLTCNKRVNFTRKNSDLHEAQLNTKLLLPIVGYSAELSLDKLYELAGFSSPKPTDNPVYDLLNKEKIDVILHAKSQGSAIEWGVENFIELAKALPANQFNIFFTGTEKEGKLFRERIPSGNHIHDLTGKMTLSELITFICKADALVAASTGPLHIAGLLDKLTVGLFAPQKPIHPGRWRPLGNKVEILEAKKIASPTQPLNISVRDVVQRVEKLTS